MYFSVRWKRCADFSPDSVPEEEGLLQWGASFGRLANGMRSTASSVPMNNVDPWISEREKGRVEGSGTLRDSWDHP